MHSAWKAVGLRAGSIVALILIWWITALLMGDETVLPGPLLIGATILTNMVTLGPEGQTAFSTSASRSRGSSSHSRRRCWPESASG